MFVVHWGTCSVVAVTSRGEGTPAFNRHLAGFYYPTVGVRLLRGHCL